MGSDRCHADGHDACAQSVCRGMPDAYHNISCVWDTVIMPPASEQDAWPNIYIKRW